jgi:predicted MFS family arabinose efflux permease
MPSDAVPSGAVAPGAVAPGAVAPGAVPSGAMPPDRPARFRDVFAGREYRALFGTFLLSMVGDELARVALALLVYQRTDSPLLAAITFAIGYLPWLLGGPILSTLADRLPRHRVMIVTDAGRAVLVAGMAVPGMPLPLLLVLMCVLALCGPPFESARSALVADVLDDDRYALANSLTGMGMQVATVVGFLLGGALVAGFSPAAALLVDAATFAISAGWLMLRLQRRPAPTAGREDGTSLWRDTGDGLRLIRRSPRLMAIIAVLWLGTAFGNAPEGLAAPLVDELGRGTTAVGVLLAAGPLGTTIGSLLLTRLVSARRREELVPALVGLSLAPLLLAGLCAALAPASSVTFGVVVALMFIGGLGWAWVIALNAAFVRAVPSAYRGRAFGVAVSGLYGAQGLGVLGAGLLAEGLAPSGVVVLCGALGLAAVVLPLLAYQRTRPSVADGAPAAGPSVS